MLRWHWLYIHYDTAVTFPTKCEKYTFWYSCSFSIHFSSILCLLVSKSLCIVLLVSLVWVVCSYLHHIHPLNTGWCLLQNYGQILSRKASGVVPIHHGSVSPFTSSSFPDWPSWSPDVARVKVSLSQLTIVPSKTATAGLIFLVTKSFSFQSSLSLLIWFGLWLLQCYCWTIWVVWPGILAPNTGLNVSESSIICIALGVILNRFSSDGLLTVAKAKIMTVFRVR